MSKMYLGKINLMQIDKKKVFHAKKTGNKWLDVVVWLNDEEDQYGNIMSIQQGMTKEERDAGAKPVYLGNLKAGGGGSGAANQTTDDKPKPQPDDDLPF